MLDYKIKLLDLLHLNVVLVSDCCEKEKNVIFAFL